MSKHLSNGKALNMKLISFYTIKDYCINMSQIQTRSSWLLSYQKCGENIQCLWKHMTNCFGVTHTYCIVKCQYYWKDMNKDIRKYIANCTLCCQEKAKVQSYPLQMTGILEWPFDKIAIDLVTECEMSTSGNKHILTIIDHLTGWLEAFPILDKSVDTIVSTFINHYLPVHMCPRYILSDNGTEFKNQLMDQVLQELSIACIFSAPYHPQSNRKLEAFHKYLKPTLEKLKRIQQIGTNTSIKFLLATEWHPILPQQKHHFFLSMAGTNATIPMQSRVWTTQSRSPSTSPHYCEENTRWALLQDCPENHGQRTTLFQNRWQSLF